MSREGLQSNCYKYVTNTKEKMKEDLQEGYMEILKTKTENLNTTKYNT